MKRECNAAPVTRTQDILMVHANQQAADSARLGMARSPIIHASFHQALMGLRFDVIVVASCPTAEGSDTRLEMLRQFADDLVLKLRPGGTIHFAPGADPRGE